MLYFIKWVFIPFVAVAVSKNYVVLSGQHLLAAAKELGDELYVSRKGRPPWTMNAWVIFILIVCES